MFRAIVGIIARRRNEPAQSDRMQTVTAGVDIAYPNSVVRAGGAPVLLPETADRQAVIAMIGRVDGLLLPGGGDVVSLAYGEEPHPTAKYQDPVLDEMEFLAARVAIDRGIPILGICRGIQSLNVALGGTLIQDIESQVPGAVQHWARPRDATRGHTIDVEPGSLLARVLGTKTLAVNSYHHQAVKDVAEGLRASARSRDGVIEGLEAADGRPILAVQCHPEEMRESQPALRNLFEWLVREAAARRSMGTDPVSGPCPGAENREETPA